MKDTPEHIQKLLKEVVDHFDKEDRGVRERQIRVWKKLKFYWNGFQRLWWSEIAHDWRVYNPVEAGTPSDAAYYDKPVNIFRAYLESIIAALSVTIPSIYCAPDDADSDLDIATARAGDKISELVGKHNDVSLLWLHALFIFCTEGMVAAYTYPKEDYKYGSYQTQKYELSEEETEYEVCPNCGTELVNEMFQDEFAPDDEDAAIQNAANQVPLCPMCQAEIVAPILQKKKIVVNRIVGVTSHPKTRQCIEVYGGLFVKVPNYAKNQEEALYLIYAYETHYANVIERYPHLKNKFGGNSKIGSSTGGMYDPYERWGRLSTQYFGEYPLNTATVRNCWLRPAAFNVLNDEADVNDLKKRYPDGVKVVMINDNFAEAENECLDDCWTLTKDPLTDYIHADPVGMLLTSLQEITNDLVSLVIQTIEHGIPQTFADPAVLNFEEYRQTEVAPGMIYPTKPVSTGKSIGEAFYEVKTAQMSGEVLPFGEKIQEFAQLVSGALPSLFGGAQPNSSKTAAQYSMSRAQALQRLQTPWKMLSIWWKTIFGKVIPAYIKDVADDERIVQRDAKTGGFINTFIRKAELEGKIGSVELESSDQLPATWAQKKDTLMQLMQAGNPMVMQALTDPDNLILIKQAIGLDDFAVPGDADRSKQYAEIQQLLASEPLPDGSPSVDIDPMVDNHAIEADICRSWAVGDAGRIAKMENPAGYTNVLLHMKRHVDLQMIMASQMMSQPSPDQNGNGNGNGQEMKKPQPQPMAAKPPRSTGASIQ